MPKSRTAGLHAVLFTDIVGSTQLAREMGDVRWSRLLAAQRRIVREGLKANHGREIDTAGDGLFALFDGPADAVRCAFVVAREVQELGLDIRAGIHVGEIETSRKEAHGVVVHTGARVMAEVGPAQVVVTQTVRDLVAGARFNMKERGTVELKGVPGTWTLFEVLSVDDEMRPEPIEGATIASERRERVSAAPPARPSRRWLVAVAVAATLTVGTGAYLALRPRPTYVPSAGTVARINLNGRFDRPVALGAFPTDAEGGYGRVWVVDQQGQIYWIDAETSAVESRGTGGTPTGVATGDGLVWITHGFGTGTGLGGGVSRFDPRSGELTPAFDTPIGSEAIEWVENRVWVAGRDTGTVTIFDPVLGRAESIPIPVGGGEPAMPEAIAVGDAGPRAVWVGDGGQGRLFRFDPPDLREVQTLRVGGAVSAIAVGPDVVWIASETADHVYSLDPGTGSVRTSIDVGASGCNAPSAVAIGSGGVWVACALSHEVVRIDPGSSTVTATLPVNGAADALTTDDHGLVWVAIRPR